MKLSASLLAVYCFHSNGVNTSAFLLQSLRAFALSMDAGNNIAGSDDNGSNTQEKQSDVTRTSAQGPPFFLGSATGGTKGGVPEVGRMRQVVSFSRRKPYLVFFRKAAYLL